MAGGLLDLDFEILGLPVVQRKLQVARGLIGDLRPAFKAIHDGATSDPLLNPAQGARVLPFTRIMREQFASKGARGGTPWPGYQAEPRYRVIKRLFGGGEDRILRWEPGNERLFPSLIDARHAEHVFEHDADGARMGTSVPYATAHQKGEGEQPFDNIPLPKRPIIALKRDDVRGWMRVFATHIEKTHEGGIRGVRVPV